MNGVGIEYFWFDSFWWVNVVMLFLIGLVVLFGC